MPNEQKQKSIFDEIRAEHKAQPVAPNTDLKETFERTTRDIAEAMTILKDRGEKTDAELARYKQNAIEQYERNRKEIEDKISAQLEEREKKFQEQMAEFQRSKAIEDEKTQKEEFRRSFQEFIKTGKVPEDSQSTEHFSRNIQINNPTSAGFMIDTNQLLGVQSQPVAMSNLYNLVKQMPVNAQSGRLSLTKARDAYDDSGIFLTEGQEATQEFELDISEIQYQAQAIAMIFKLSRPYLQAAVNPEFTLSEDADKWLTRITNRRILRGNNSTGPSGIVPEMQLADSKQKYKAYNSATANTVALQDLKNLWGHPKIGAYRQNAKWFMSPQALAELRFEAGTNGQFKWSTDIRDGIPLQLNGQPVIEVFEMDGIETGKYPIFYGDMSSAYVLVESNNSHMIRDEVTLSSSDKVRFIFFRYLDGKPVDTDALVGLRVA